MVLKLRNLVLTGLFALVVLGWTSEPSQAGRQTTSCLPSILKKRLAQIRKKFGRVTIISTIRRGARIAGTGRRSKHADCRAVDFKVRNKMKVWRWLNKIHKGGVGVYHGSCSHIHIDNGHRARWNRNYCG
jgi:uncharacterized protein YcbK (DUF882 family)